MEAIIRKEQKEWADSQSKVRNEDYLCFYEDNLFENLGEKEIKQFSDASGQELLDKKNSKAKMLALHSSSALCVNFFLYLQKKGKLNVILKTLDLNCNICESLFEKPYKTGSGKFPASIDYAITTDNLLIGIESKFTEHYYSHKDQSILKQSYLKKPDYSKVKSDLFESTPVLMEWIDTKWTNIEYTNKSKKYHGKAAPYEFLDAAQLVKHILGLKSDNRRFVLIYLHYDRDCPENIKHQEEVEDFGAILNKDGIKFISISYQELFRKILPYLKEDVEYVNYLKTRYRF